MTFGPSPSIIDSRQVADKLLNGTGIHSHPFFDETLILAASVLCHYQPSQLVSFPMHRQMMRYDPEREEAKENGEKGGGKGGFGTGRRVISSTLLPRVSSLASPPA
jgi:hypothetical protein